MQRRRPWQSGSRLRTESSRCGAASAAAGIATASYGALCALLNTFVLPLLVAKSDVHCVKQLRMQKGFCACANAGLMRCKYYFLLTHRNTFVKYVDGCFPQAEVSDLQEQRRQLESSAQQSGRSEDSR